MKIKKEYLVLAAVIIALSLYLVLYKSDNVHYQLPKLTDVQQKSITRVEITRGGKTISLKRNNDTWRINPEQYPADTDTVKRMLDILEELSVTALVSESENYVRYELDPENRIHVKAYDGEKVVRDFYIGKTAPSFNHTFIRLNKQAEVYHARENFRSRFDQTVAALRDKTVLAFAINDIHGVVVRTGKKERTFARQQVPVEVKTAKAQAEAPARAEETRTVWQDSSGNDIEDTTMNQFLSTLFNLKCKAYLNDSDKDAMKNPIYTATLEGIEKHTLSVFPAKGKDAAEYPAVSSDNDYVFTLEKSRVESLMKTFDAAGEKKS